MQIFHGILRTLLIFHFLSRNEWRKSLIYRQQLMCCSSILHFEPRHHADGYNCNMKGMRAKYSWKNCFYQHYGILLYPLFLLTVPRKQIQNYTHCDMWDPENSTTSLQQQEIPNYWHKEESMVQEKWWWLSPSWRTNSPKETHRSDQFNLGYNCK